MGPSTLTSEENMIEEPNNEGPQAEESRLTPEEQKKILYITLVIILMAASFLAGRFSVGKTQAPDPFSQLNQVNPLNQQSGQSGATAPSSITEASLGMINFSGVSDSKKAEVLAKYNTQSCGCGCKMSVLDCIIKDPNCPMWKDHINEVQKALGNGKTPDFSKIGHPAMPFTITAPVAKPH
ncbi:MAG TPA: hypothetical protein VMV05_09510 [bacterium]|nr:hypothetical protein [bacterium]